MNFIRYPIFWLHPIRYPITDIQYENIEHRKNCGIKCKSCFLFSNFAMRCLFKWTSVNKGITKNSQSSNITAPKFVQ